MIYEVNSFSQAHKGGNKFVIESSVSTDSSDLLKMTNAWTESMNLIGIENTDGLYTAVASLHPNLFAANYNNNLFKRLAFQTWIYLSAKSERIF